MGSEPTFNFSQTSLQDYADCARRYQLRYLDQLHWPAVETEPVLENEKHILEGQLFHRLVHQYLLGIPVEMLNRQATGSELSRWWKNFLDHGPDLDGARLFPEHSLTAPVSSQRLTAKFDLIALSQDGSAAIYDWKTYHRRPAAEWFAARWQTRVYRSLLARAGAHLNGGETIEPDRIQMVYWLADDPTDPVRLGYSASQHRRDWDTIEKVIEEIHAAREFPLTDDRKKCNFCPYRSYCDRGVQAGDLANVDVETDTLSMLDQRLEQIGEIEF